MVLTNKAIEEVCVQGAKHNNTQETSAYVLIDRDLFYIMDKKDRVGLKHDLKVLRSNGCFGLGIYAYLDAVDHIRYIKKRADSENKRVVELKIDSSKLINTLTDAGQRNIRHIVEIMEQEGKEVHSDSDLFKYISTRADGIIGMVVEGNTAFEESAISKEYIGRMLCIYDESIIREYKLVV